MNKIKFWDHREPHGWLSNFWMAEIVIDGVPWPSAEHYYQAQKHAGTSLTEAIRREPDAKGAKSLARSHPYAVNWSRDTKISVMRKALEAKFIQHKDLMEKLMATGRDELVEASPEDSYWGSGPNGDGLNLMGILLMEIRATLATGRLER